MDVGHTHEDIDAVFRVISQRWQRDGYVLTPSGFRNMVKVNAARLPYVCHFNAAKTGHILFR
eukprot:1758720-Pyramimonas_sp.AAC.1